VPDILSPAKIHSWPPAVDLRSRSRMVCASKCLPTQPTGSYSFSLLSVFPVRARFGPCSSPVDFLNAVRFIGLYHFFVTRLKLELFFPHCPVLFDSHRPGCRPQLLLLVVESLPNLKFPVHGSKSQLVKGSRDQAWSVLICLQSRWCLGHV
jgi:hypothetical protein